MNAIIITLYVEALVLFALIGISAFNVKREEAKHHADELRGHAVSRHAF